MSKIIHLYWKFSTKKSMKIMPKYLFILTLIKVFFFITLIIFEKVFLLFKKNTYLMKVLLTCILSFFSLSLSSSRFLYFYFEKFFFSIFILSDMLKTEANDSGMFNEWAINP